MPASFRRAPAPDSRGALWTHVAYCYDLAARAAESVEHGSAPRTFHVAEAHALYDLLGRLSISPVGLHRLVALPADAPRAPRRRTPAPEERPALLLEWAAAIDARMATPPTDASGHTPAAYAAIARVALHLAPEVRRVAQELRDGLPTPTRA